ncbi:MAG: hypothetical protein HY340_03700 [Candidatus Kerfeldbacteria bacterium]|nr:hypothetical protein [Candidatus Kerfeldbacteria bacterium]
MEKATLTVYGESLVVEFLADTIYQRTTRCSYCGEMGANTVAVQIARVVGKNDRIGPTAKQHIIAKFLLERVLGRSMAFCKRCLRPPHGAHPPHRKGRTDDHQHRLLSSS